jgi:hypothetical protein
MCVHCGKNVVLLKIERIPFGIKKYLFVINKNYIINERESVMEGTRE